MHVHVILLGNVSNVPTRAACLLDLHMHNIHVQHKIRDNYMSNNWQVNIQCNVQGICWAECLAQKLRRGCDTSVILSKWLSCKDMWAAATLGRMTMTQHAVTCNMTCKWPCHITERATWYIVHVHPVQAGYTWCLHNTKSVLITWR